MDDLPTVSVGHLNQLSFTDANPSQIGAFKFRVADVSKNHFEVTGEAKRINARDTVDQLISFVQQEADSLASDFAFRPFLKFLVRVVEVVEKCNALLLDGRSLGTLRQASACLGVKRSGFARRYQSWGVVPKQLPRLPLLWSTHEVPWHQNLRVIRFVLAQLQVSPD